MAASLDFAQEEWELDQLQKRKEEEEAAADEDDEVLFYEVQQAPPLDTAPSGKQSSGRGRKRSSLGPVSGSETDGTSGGGDRRLSTVSAYLMQSQGALGGYDTQELSTLELPYSL